MTPKYFLNYMNQLCITRYTVWCPFCPFLKLLKHTGTLDQIQLLYKAETFLPGFSGFISISHGTSFFLSSREQTQAYCSYKSQWSFMSLILHPWALLWDHSVLYSRTVDNFVDFFSPPVWRIFASPINSQMNFPRLEQYPLNVFRI